MIHFTKYVPASATSPCTHYEYDAKSLKEILKKEKYCLESSEHNFVWAQGDSRTLMISDTKSNCYFEIGFVDGIDLTNYLPNCALCKIFSGTCVKVVRALIDRPPLIKDTSYMVSFEDERQGEPSEYCVISRDNFADSLGWFKEGIDVQFERYATQEEIDNVNAYRQSIKEHLMNNLLCAKDNSENKVTKEYLKERIEQITKDLGIAYEDFVGTTYTEDVNVWKEKFIFLMNDTALFSHYKNDMARVQKVLTYKKEMEKLFLEYKNN